ncbi:protein of unknown function [Legionella hackeliae]|uniref:Uncharacterized protein n=1 Tax=Legionella hackeliae TaxID=449 RepID=A0A0A8UPP5_LEGHA|nr:protein of unknown function [Legionella hackeliae]
MRVLTLWFTYQSCYGLLNNGSLGASSLYYGSKFKLVIVNEVQQSTTPRIHP